VNPLRNWIENWLFGDRLRVVEGQVMYANDHADELRERCADIETEYATDQALSDLSEKVDDLESELEDIKRRILEQKKQIQIMDKILADHLDRHNQPT
jgi:predicted nucleotide-binding protein (sugar kinase/HSP70/actin superfamily)